MDWLETIKLTYASLLYSNPTRKISDGFKNVTRVFATGAEEGTAGVTIIITVKLLLVLVKLSQ